MIESIKIIYDGRCYIVKFVKTRSTSYLFESIAKTVIVALAKLGFVLHCAGLQMNTLLKNFSKSKAMCENCTLLSA